MKERESPPQLSHSDLLVKIKECLSAFEDLRGYL
jgi:hypothetical protein